MFCFVTLVIGCIFIGYTINLDEVRKAERLKLICEQHLPRNQKCEMVFIAPEKPSNDKTSVEVGDSIPK